MNIFETYASVTFNFTTINKLATTVWMDFNSFLSVSPTTQLTTIVDCRLLQRALSARNRVFFPTMVGLGVQIYQLIFFHHAEWFNFIFFMGVFFGRRSVFLWVNDVFYWIFDGFIGFNGRVFHFDGSVVLFQQIVGDFCERDDTSVTEFVDTTTCDSGAFAGYRFFVNQLLKIKKNMKMTNTLETGISIKSCMIFFWISIS